MSETDQERKENKLTAKMKENPSVPIGLLGLLGVVAYGAYNFKNRKFKTSLYLINLRVAAQGTLISCMTLGLLYSMVTNNWHKIFPEKKN